MKSRWAALKVLHSLLRLHDWNGRVGGRFWHWIKNTTASTKHKVRKRWTWKRAIQMFFHALTSLFTSQKISRVWTSFYYRNGCWPEEKVNIETQHNKCWLSWSMILPSSSIASIIRLEGNQMNPNTRWHACARGNWNFFDCSGASFGRAIAARFCGDDPEAPAI